MPDFSLEIAARANGVKGPVIGVDEVGRGPWAGPVYACAALLFEQSAPPEFLNALADSKALSKKKREALAPEISKYATVALAEATVREIEEFNILGATKLAMQRAVNALQIQIETPIGLALIDGNQPPKLSCDAQSVVKGDGISASIAAAAIFAKVARDRHMATLAIQHPGYGWERNAGYGVAAHKTGLYSLGVTIHHRRTFTPVSKLLTQKDS
jgi:ribonuclease HII